MTNMTFNHNANDHAINNIYNSQSSYNEMFGNHKLLNMHIETDQIDADFKKQINKNEAESLSHRQV